MGNGLLVLSQD